MMAFHFHVLKRDSAEEKHLNFILPRKISTHIGQEIHGASNAQSENSSPALPVVPFGTLAELVELE